RYRFPGFSHRHPSKLPCPMIEGAIVINDADGFQVMALRHLPVVEIMSWCNLHRPCSKRWIYVFIGDDADFKRSIQSLGCNDLADVFLVAFVIWVDGYCGIAELCLRTSRCQGKRPVF